MCSERIDPSTGLRETNVPVGEQLVLVVLPLQVAHALFAAVPEARPERPLGVVRERRPGRNQSGQAQEESYSSRTHGESHITAIENYFRPNEPQ